MKSIKYLVVLVCITLGLVNVAKAQISDSDVMFFGNTTSMRIICFVNGELWDGTHTTVNSVKNKLKTNPNNYDFPKGFDNSDMSRFVYNESLSTSSRIVYRRKDSLKKNCIAYQYAISPDMSSLIWFVTDANGNVLDQYGREYFVRVAKEDLLPQLANPKEIDFLND